MMGICFAVIIVLGKLEWVSVLSAIGVTARITGTVLVSRLGRKYEKHSLIFAGACLMAYSASALFMADSFVLTALFQILRRPSIGLVYVCTWSVFWMERQFLPESQK